MILTIHLSSDRANETYPLDGPLNSKNTEEPCTVKARKKHNLSSSGSHPVGFRRQDFFSPQSVALNYRYKKLK